MADNNKLIAVGPNAAQFHCMITGITITQGYPVTLTPAQYKSKRIKQALNSGHLQVLQVEANEVTAEVDTDKLLAKFKALAAAGKTAENISKAFSLSDLKSIAESLDYESSEEDTKLSLAETIMEDDELKK